MRGILRKQRDNSVSRYFEKCMGQIRLPNGARALDIPCGYGRHAFWLAARSYDVVGVDIDKRRIEAAKLDDARQLIRWMIANVEEPLDLPPASFDLVVTVHYVSPTIIGLARNLLRNNGFLIFETFAAHGQNWRLLPERGAVRQELSRGFQVLDMCVRDVGPTKTNEVVSALATRVA